MPTCKRKLREIGKRGLRLAFEAGQRFGVDILPHHFYSEIPIIRELRREDDWKKPYSMAGIRGSEPDRQLHFLSECCSEDLVARQKKGDIYQRVCTMNGEPGFDPVDADFLFCWITSKRPRRIVQIGCGVSTAVMLLAAKEAAYRPEITCIEPYPTDFLRERHESGEITLIPKKAEDVGLETMTGIGKDDLLFVDSSHTVKPGGHVSRIILEVLPRLEAGCWVHFHDVWFPYDYHYKILSQSLFFWHESVLLQAFLTNNCKYEIFVSLCMLHHSRCEELPRCLPNYRPAPHDHGVRLSAGHFPTSIYLRTVK